ncbi:DNA polymerase III subunit gamma/tau [Biformimicrobium ophioploci]|uniref:DNA polymerase III subunit gamma/tau n=1 Tax=Biformimicrobium ophioploci TaxID=3036711 RepID=A0ABQ6LYW2_9GAMM|nr:DNA polymerase III subunit gamma/tau [Microbulbifer sp. NKW57]GMG87281.1 DNA polymerase III subunit gamma/tau [Microbulbifer sp. NKW57]
MSYQVLARKWRPRVFREMVGQEHVLQALINALDHGRLHHAYLFTGTRGVGKTTIARILAKCLNCETGISSEPCGTCGTCTEIAEGRFVDLIEVDAASRTKVEDTRELLENVQYAPTRGRYKVYLIDEVHMLSNSSFNALLKTLEEPPPHVKFLLATTDPQKLPVTVLSRCLQFNLKNMSPERIVEHLKYVLEKELVPFDEPALWQLGRAADGSMRDAMSLTDQAIAFGGGKVLEPEVRAMLGTIDAGLVWKILEALQSEQPAALFDAVAQLAEQAPDYRATLGELASCLHRIAMAQAVPDAVDNALGDRDQVLEFARQMPAENIQLYYQMAILARKDLPLAPDPRGGFEMALLRMLAFRPQGVDDIPVQTLEAAQQQAVQPVPHQEAPDQQAPQQEVPAPAKKPEAEVETAAVTAVATEAPQAPAPQVQPAPQMPEQAVPAPEECPPWAMPEEQPSEASAELQSPAPVEPQVSAQQQAPATAPVESAADKAAKVAALRAQLAQVESAPRPASETPLRKPEAAAPVTAETGGAPEPDAVNVEGQGPEALFKALSPGSWPAIYPQLKVSGILHSISSHMELVGRQENLLAFTLDEEFSSLYDEAHQRRLADLFSDFFGQPVQVQIQVGRVSGGTPARLATATREAKLVAARDSLAQNPVVRGLCSTLGAELLDESVEYLE